MKPFLWMTCAVLAACAVGFSAYRMLVGEASERIPATRLVIEHDASLLPTMGMMRLENAGFSSMVHGLEKGKKFLSVKRQMSGRQWHGFSLTSGGQDVQKLFYSGTCRLVMPRLEVPQLWEFNGLACK